MEATSVGKEPQVQKPGRDGGCGCCQVIPFPDIYTGTPDPPTSSLVQSMILFQFELGNIKENGHSMTEYKGKGNANTLFRED